MCSAVIAVLAWVVIAAVASSWPPCCATPSMEPQAARNAGRLSVSPVAPARRMNVRRSNGSIGIGWTSMARDDERVLRVPREQHLATGPERVAAVAVLLHDGDLVAGGSADDVLERRAEERRAGARAPQDVAPVARAALVLGDHDVDLLGAPPRAQRAGGRRAVGVGPPQRGPAGGAELPATDKLTVEQ